MLEREGLVEEPGQDKGTDKIKEGTVEEDGTHLAPFDYVTLSPFRSEGAKQINHPLCGCASKVIPS